VAAGITAWLCCNTSANRRQRWAVVPFILLAACPDLDYVAVWLAGYNATPRFTHSILFALSTALLAQWLMRAATASRLPLLWLFLASASHPVLDLLVGAHPVPLLWPFGAEVAATVGVLPSAGALALDNYFLWRNLLIELGVLLPVFALCAAVCRRTSIKRIAVWTACIAPVWTGFLCWSLTLSR
ncbi:MAG: metal-dependent hydrolase, partial [Stenotrophomonas sp.]